MQKEVLYRKWRPKSLTEILGQEEIVTLLMNSINHKRLSQSYLFSGPSGTGKTSTARAFAKSVNCENYNTLKSDISNCTCSSCNSINDYSSNTLVELDAASSIRQVEDLTEVMLQKINFLSGENKFKVYILDEVHMLSRHSFNALLKTLEEPPGHLIIILVTTDPQKIPQTILSRCQIVEFKAIDQSNISTKLIKIAQNEKITLTEKDANIIASHANGSLRNAENLLEKCILKQNNNKIDENLIRYTLGIISDEIPVKILNYVQSKDLSSALKLLNEEINKGSNFNSIMNEFRKTCVKLIHCKYGLESEQSAISKMASGLEITTIKKISEIVNADNIINIENFRLKLEIIIIELFELFQISSDKNQNTLSEIKNNVNVENEKISSKQNKTPQVQVQQQTSNVSPQNNSIEATTDLMKFIQVFENKNWYWKIKAVKNYKVHENLLNLYFDHQSQIDMLKVEINKPESIQLAKSAIVSIWGKELSLNLKLTNNNEETENKSNEIDNKALFLSEASKYGKLISLKEIKNES
tara:strand:- start:15 stop:1598 length:1584 start_codon:yes stop_codon:yes gene_type:complete